MDREDFIEMRVGGLTLDPVTKTPIVILRDIDNKLNLPIWVGLMEATAMATELEGIKMARPMTHDLLRNLIADLGGIVESVEVTELRDNTYYAEICLQAGGRKIVIDSRQRCDFFSITNEKPDLCCEEGPRSFKRVTASRNGARAKSF